MVSQNKGEVGTTTKENKQQAIRKKQLASRQGKVRHRWQGIRLSKDKREVVTR